MSSSILRPLWTLALWQHEVAQASPYEPRGPICTGAIKDSQIHASAAEGSQKTLSPKIANRSASTRQRRRSASLNGRVLSHPSNTEPSEASCEQLQLPRQGVAGHPRGRRQGRGVDHDRPANILLLRTPRYGARSSTGSTRLTARSTSRTRTTSARCSTSRRSSRQRVRPSSTRPCSSTASATAPCMTTEPSRSRHPRRRFVSCSTSATGSPTPTHGSEARARADLRPGMLRRQQPQSGTQTAAKLQELEASLAERDEKLTALLIDREALDDELVRLRAEVAKAKKEAAEHADTHDYSEAETRTHLIDESLHEAGWPLDRRARPRVRSLRHAEPAERRGSSTTSCGATTASRSGLSRRSAPPSHR